MPTYINHIVTEVPDFKYDQSYIRDFMKHHVANDRKSSLGIHHIYKQSAIESRYSVIPDFQANQNAEPDDPARFDLNTRERDGYIFTNAEKGTLNSPTTGQRNKIYEHEARKLFTNAASRLIDEVAEVQPSDVTHVITVSCTGFYAPGPDFDIMKNLGLSPSTQRFHIGFMGCYASFPALRLAKSLCDSDENAVVLVVSAELCTLHLKFESDPDSLISTSVFADGCAAALISNKKDWSVDASYELSKFSSLVTPTGAEDMAWTIGDNGFDMILSTYIPEIIGANLHSVMDSLIGDEIPYESLATEIDLWAVHPGGRAIVDKVAGELNLSEEQVASSRTTLKNYGNMSSATILFVLKDMMNQAKEQEQSVLGMAFGPGLTVESGLFTLRSV